jgi:hypothetical protein
MRPRVQAFTAAYLPLIAILAAALLMLCWASPVLAADSVPTGAQGRHPCRLAAHAGRIEQRQETRTLLPYLGQPQWPPPLAA